MPNLAKWIKNQVPLRDITVYENTSGNCEYNVGWRDNLTFAGKSTSRSHILEDAVMGSEIKSLFEAPPLKMDFKNARKCLDYLNGIGFLNRTNFNTNYTHDEIYQFRV